MARINQRINLKANAQQLLCYH